MTKHEATAAALVAMVDELGDLEIAVAPFKAKIARADVLRKALRAKFSEAPAGTPFVLDGERFTALLGVMGNESVVDKAALYKLAGWKKYVEISSVSLKAIDEACGVAVLGAVVSIAQTGSRSLSVVAKA
jgi:hypothetical protein